MEPEVITILNAHGYLGHRDWRCEGCCCITGGQGNNGHFLTLDHACGVVQGIEWLLTEMRKALA